MYICLEFGFLNTYCKWDIRDHISICESGTVCTPLCDDDASVPGQAEVGHPCSSQRACSTKYRDLMSETLKF